MRAHTTLIQVKARLGVLPYASCFRLDKTAFARLDEKCQMGPETKTIIAAFFCLGRALTDAASINKDMKHDHGRHPDSHPLRVKTPSRPARRDRSAPRGMSRDLMPTLANLYQSVLAEPIPEPILMLLEQLDRKPQ